MDGLINLNKPTGVTSAAALEAVRRALGAPKSGHAGTLDPLAEGVLLICLGRATKLVEALMDLPKIYRTTIALDRTNDTYDLEHPTVPVPIDVPPTMEEVRAGLQSFEGLVQQTPPASSAVKVGGRPAYRLSRAGRPPTLSPRPVRIYWLHLLRYTWPELECEVACGRGTYIRALARDIGLQLRTGACVTRLARRAVGPFHVDDAVALERISGLPAVPRGAAALVPPPAFVTPLPRARELIAAARSVLPARPA